jgi:hypothetical protein
MNVTQDHITADTKMGANLLRHGATFRVWAPRAQAVYVNGRFGAVDLWNKEDLKPVTLPDLQKGRSTPPASSFPHLHLLLLVHPGVRTRGGRWFQSPFGTAWVLSAKVNVVTRLINPAITPE